MFYIYLTLIFLCLCILYFLHANEILRGRIKELSEIVAEVTVIQGIDGDRLTDLEDTPNA